MTDSALSTLPPDAPETGLLHPPIAPFSAPHPTLLHSGMSIPRFFGLHAMAILFPLMAGIAFYGWRTLVVVGILVLTTSISMAIWRRIGRRGAQLHYSHALWLAVLLSTMLPPHLASISTPDPRDAHLWAILAGAGMVLVMFMWVLGGLGAGRISPVLVTYLLIVVFFPSQLVPYHVLQRGHLVTGDVLDVRAVDTEQTPTRRWLQMAIIPGHDAIAWEPASQRLWMFTTATRQPDRSWLTLESLLRDRMPPLEDLVLGGTPGPIGTSSTIAVIIGGLFLLYRGLIDYRIPLLIFLSAFIAMLILPLPVVITESSPQGRWMIFREAGVGWAAAITFVNYELLAGPALFMSFFLATSPAVRPMTRRGRTIYALLIGVTTAVFQLYTSVAFGPYLALLLVSLITPMLDKKFRPRPLV